jgi:hypothetical protein
MDGRENILCLDGEVNTPQDSNRPMFDQFDNVKFVSK